MIDSALEHLTSALEATMSESRHVMEQIATAIVGCIKDGGKVLLCGNGGSAADCQHVAAEFVNRFRLERSPLPAIALTTDTSILTSIANDYSFDQVFSKQVRSIGVKGDVLIGISTSGRSKNVLMALDVAKEMGLVTVGFTGNDPREMEHKCDLLLRVASKDTPRIQEIHIFCAHLVCDLVERSMFGK